MIGIIEGEEGGLFDRGTKAFLLLPSPFSLRKNRRHYFVVFLKYVVFSGIDRYSWSFVLVAFRRANKPHYPNFVADSNYVLCMQSRPVIIILYIPALHMS